MDASQVLASNFALAAAWASPGRAMLIALRATLSGGRGAGVAAGIGLAAVAAGWALLALAGLEAVFRRFPAANVALKTAGALFLRWIAWSTWIDRTAACVLGALGLRLLVER